MPASSYTRLFVLWLLVFASAANAVLSATLEDEKTIWDLEHAYWRYVENNDLRAYRDLWHEAFLGWPAVNATPVRKDHITDWITSQTSKGFAFKAGELKPAAIQITGDVAFACYWISLRWVNKEEKGDMHVLRITHTWMRSGNDWRIIGGMSMPETQPAVP